MLRRADRALLMAKENGRNQVVQLGGGMNGRADESGDDGEAAAERRTRRPSFSRHSSRPCPPRSPSRSSAASWPTTRRRSSRSTATRSNWRLSRRGDNRTPPLERPAGQLPTRPAFRGAAGAARGRQRRSERGRRVADADFRQHRAAEVPRPPPRRCPAAGPAGRWSACVPISWRRARTRRTLPNGRTWGK